ncbi:hypothetical protein HanIR_Chr05g0217891 [Helianthus annuus]|nr:hypothetical protein HanIR_Chr05g0217891 [Helianthus annuus]
MWKNVHLSIVTFNPYTRGMPPPCLVNLHRHYSHVGDILFTRLTSIGIFIVDRRGKHVTPASNGFLISYIWYVCPPFFDER